MEKDYRRKSSNDTRSASGKSYAGQNNGRKNTYQKSNGSSSNTGYAKKSNTYKGRTNSGSTTRTQDNNGYGQASNCYNKPFNNDRNRSYGKKPTDKKIKPPKRIDYLIAIEPFDRLITNEKRNAIKDDLANPTYISMDTIIRAAISTVRDTEGKEIQTVYHVKSNRSRWDKLHAITFQIDVCKKDDENTKRTLLVYLVAKTDTMIQLIIADHPDSSNAILFSYFGDRRKLDFYKYLTRTLDSTRRLLSNLPSFHAEQKLKSTENDNKTK